MALTILDPTVAANVAAAADQTAQRAALLAPWAGGPVTVQSRQGATLRDAVTYGAWVLDSSTPRGATLGARQAGSVTTTGAPDRFVFRAGSTDIFSVTAAVSPGVADVVLPAAGAGVRADARTSLVDAVLGSFRVSADPALPVASVGATALTLSVPNSGTNSVPATVTITPNGPIPGGGLSVTLALSGGGTLGATSFSFTGGSTAAQTTTLTRSTAGTSTVTMTNTGGLTNTGSPAGFTSSAAVSAGTWQQLTVAPHSRKVITESITTGSAFDPAIAITVDARTPQSVSAIPYRSFCRPVMGEPGMLYYYGSLHSNYPGNEIDRIDIRNLASTVVSTTLSHQPRVSPQGVDSGYGSGSGLYVYRQYGTALADPSEWQPYTQHTWTKNGWHPTWGFMTQGTYALADGVTVGANPLGAGSAYQQSSNTQGLWSYDFAEGKYKVRVPTAPGPNFADQGPGISGMSDWNQHTSSVLALASYGGFTYVAEVINNNSTKTNVFNFDQAALAGSTWGWADATSGNGILVKWLEGSRYLCYRADFNKFSSDPASAFQTLFLINLEDATRVRKLEIPAGALTGVSLGGNGNLSFAVDRNSRRVFWLVFQANDAVNATQFVRFYVSTFDDLLNWTLITTTGFPAITNTTFQSTWIASIREPMHFYDGHLFVTLPEGGGPSDPGYTNGAANIWRVKVDGGEALPSIDFARYDYFAQNPGTSGFRFSNTSVANLQMIGTKHVNWAYRPANGTFYQCGGDFGMSFCNSTCTMQFDGKARGYTFTEVLSETALPASGKIRPSSPDDGHWFYVPTDSAWIAGRGKFVFLRGGDGTGMFGNLALRALYGASSEAGTGAQVAAAVADGWSVVDKFTLFDPAAPDGFTNLGPTFTHNAGPNTFTLSDYNGWTQDNGGTFFQDVWTAPAAATRCGAFDPVTGCVWRFYPSFLARFDMTAKTVRLYNVSQWTSPATSRVYSLDGSQPASAGDVVADGSMPAFGFYDEANTRWKTHGAFEWEHKALWLDAATGFLYVVSPATGYLWRFDTRATLSTHVADNGWRMTFGPVGDRVPLVGCYPTLNSLATYPPVVFSGDPKMNSLLLPYKGGLLWLSPGHHDHGASGEPHYAFWRRLGYTGPWSVVTMPQEFAANAGAAKAPYSADNDELMLISQAFTDVEDRQFYRYFWNVRPRWQQGQNARISIGGQSNAAGFASSGGDLNASPLNADAGLYSQYLADFTRVFIWNPVAGAYQNLRYGVNQQAIGSANIGPEFGPAIEWMRKTTTGNLYIDKYAEGGQPISYFQNGGAFFTEALARRAAQNAWLSTNGVTAVEVAWVWVQGESDSAATESAYLAALETLTTDRVSSGLMPAGVKRVIVQMRPGTALYGAGVAAAKATYAARNTALNTVVTMPSYFDSDNIHLNCRGQLQMGYEIFSKVFGTARIEV